MSSSTTLSPQVLSQWKDLQENKPKDLRGPPGPVGLAIRKLYKTKMTEFMDSLTPEETAVVRALTEAAKAKRKETKAAEAAWVAERRKHLSKTLSYVLRHGAHNEGLDVDSSGAVQLTALLCLPTFAVTSEADIRELVKGCPKRRYELSGTGSDTRIRATYGHTFVVTDP